MQYIKYPQDEKPQIAKKEAFATLLNYRLPNSYQSITELIEGFDNQITKIEPKVTQGALSNAHGDWYEWLIGFSAWNFAANNPTSHLAIPLPNIKKFDVSQLYNHKLFRIIQDLREKVTIASNVQLITSNPDFVIISRGLADKILGGIRPIGDINIHSIEEMDGLYSKFSGKCTFDDIVGYLSVKLSLRPDRRLQIPHEGSLMKALYIHLQTREWILNPKGIQYYAIASQTTDADKMALKTVATHSITTVHSIPQPAVDDVFDVNSLSDAELVFQKILL